MALRTPRGGLGAALNSFESEARSRTKTVPSEFFAPSTLCKGTGP